MRTCRTFRLLVGALVLSSALAASAGAETVAFTHGDTTADRVYFGYGGAGRENLSAVLSDYTDPVTGASAPITAPDGSPLVVGNVDLGESPSSSDQTQIQALYTDADQQYRLVYTGLGRAGYLNVMGVYTYESGDALTDYAFVPLVTQGVDAPGTEVLFDVPANHYFGFYLSADGGRSERNRFYSENILNTDGGDVETDHMLAFATNRGLLLAWEDLPYNASTGKMGDQDYEDMIGGLLKYGNGTPVPEPATMILLGGGIGMMLATKRRDERKTVSQKKARTN